MISEDTLAAFLNDALETNAREAVAAELARDPDALDFVIQQRQIDQALRSLLSPPSRKTHLRHSIRAAVTGMPREQLRAQVRAGTIGLETLETTATRRNLPNEAATGKLQIPAGEPWRRFWATLASTSGLARGLMAAATGLVVIGLALWLGVFGHRDPTPPVIGVLAEVVGVPTVQRSGQSQAVDATPGISVLDGDRLETGDADRAEIRFRDGTTLRLAFNTSIELPLAAHPQMPDTNALLRPPEVRLLKGQIWTKVAKLTNAPAYAIRTEAATAIARGTEFGVKLARVDRAATNSPFAAVLTVKEGVVDFINALGSVRATAMTESTATFGSAPTEPKRLQTVRSAALNNGAQPWMALSSPLEAWEAGLRLAGGAGYAGVFLQTRTNASAGGAITEIVVTQVAAGSPAERAGLRPADVLLHLDGRPVTNLHRVIAAIRLQPNRTLALTVRTDAQERSVFLQPAHQPNEVTGPSLDDRDAALLTRLMERWLEQTPAATERDRLAQASQVSKDERLQGAAHNNLAVLHELQDAFGPAIRAYGRAVRLQPHVPLYRFNLGMALRKAGSLERAAEEFEIARRQTPGSVNVGQWHAEVLSMLGRHGEATLQLDALLSAHPEHHGLWELKARLLTDEHRYDEATKAARKAVETAPGCAVARSYLGGALMGEGRALEAEQEYRKAVELAPFSAEVHMHHGLALNLLDRAGEAEAGIRKALELQPDFQLAWRNLGGVLGDRGQWEQAAAALQKAAELDPEDVAVFRDLGRLAVKQGRLDQAEIHFRRALAAAPDDPESYSELGTVQADSGQRIEAEKSYLQGIALHPRNPVLHEHLAAVYVGLGRSEKAVEFYRKAVELGPRRPSPYNGLAYLMAGRGDLDAAERLLRQAAGFAPNDPRTHNNLGEVLRMQGKLDEAAAVYRRVLQTSPADPNAYHNLGVLQAMQGRFSEAETIFRTLINRAKNDARIPPLSYILNLADACKHQGKLMEAEQAYRDALAIDPDRPTGLNRLAWFLAEHQLHLDEALLLARQAAQIQPGKPDYLDTLGWVHFQRGELDDARNHLSKALNLSPSDSVAAEIRAHLQKVEETRALRP